MRDLIPKNLPNGKELVDEGKQIGKTVQLGPNGFDQNRDQSFFDWFLTEQFSDNIILFPQLGLKTLDEQVEGIKKLYDESQKRGLNISSMFVTASLLNALPFNAREHVPSGTSYVYSGVEDYKRVALAAPLMVIFGDFCIGSPNSVENTINSLAAGTIGVGTMSQFSWRYPYWNDEVSQIAETVKAMGIVAAKRDDMISVGSYIGDGIPSSFIDHASMVGYTLVEKYVADKLCGALYTMGMGGLMNNVVSKCATWLAIHEAGKGEDGMSITGHYEGNTIDVTGDFAYNYGLVATDFLPFAILERKYKTGALYTPKPVTESMRVPTVEEVIDVSAACRGAMKRVEDFEAANLFDDTEIISLRDKLITGGKQFFENVINGLEDLGIDIEDPAQILMALKRLGAKELEERFHSGEGNASQYRGFKPVTLTGKQKKYNELIDKFIDEINEKNLAGNAKDKSIVIASADTHEFAVYIMTEVLSKIGARVIDGGVDRDPDYLLELADKENAPFIAISLHNGQCVDWAKKFAETAAGRHQEVRLFAGGVLNTMAESSSEPVDARKILEEIGITPCKDIVELVKYLA